MNILKTPKTLTKILNTAFICLSLFSCATIPQKNKIEPPAKENVELSRSLTSQGKLTAIELTKYFLSQNPDSNITEILNLSADYIAEARTENINSDVAFAQMCLETGYLRFGGLVQKEWHNYCGLGAMDIDHPGEQFDTALLGVRAHIQHLQAYATTEDVTLKNELIDPRYNWVHKTKYVQDIYGLAGTWATDKEYGNKINGILNRMEEMINN